MDRPANPLPPSADAAAPSLGTHFSRYLVGNLFALIASFISFPILTRLLDNHEYGVLGYFDTWLVALLAVVKLGGQHSITRFYPHGQPTRLRAFVSSFLLVPFRCAFVAWLVLIVGYYLVSRGMEGEARLVGWFMVALILPLTWTSYASALIGIEERSMLYMRLVLVQRWGEMLAIVSTVYFLRRDAAGAYGARLVVTCAIALWLAHWVFRHYAPNRRDAVRASWVATLPYALPLVANEISGSVLGLLDRVMLKEVLNDFVPVGIFAIGAGLAATLNSIVNQALSVAFTQVSMRQYALEGTASVVKTKRDSLHIMVYAYIMLMMGVICVGRDFLLLLSGPDKAASAPVFVALGVCYLGYGIVDLMGSGLLLVKRSKTMLALNLTAALLTIAVNLALIPHFGVTGAIYATVCGYTALGVGQFLCCPRDLRAWPELRPLATALALAALLAGTVFATDLFGLSHPLTRFLAMAPLSLILFALPAVLIDPVLRGYARTWLQRRRRG